MEFTKATAKQIYSGEEGKGRVERVTEALRERKRQRQTKRKREREREKLAGGRVDNKLKNAAAK